MKKNVMMCFRVTEEEKRRIELVVKRAQERNQLAVLSDVIKDLMGLTSLGLVDEADRQILGATAVFSGSTEVTASATVTHADGTVDGPEKEGKPQGFQRPQMPKDRRAKTEGAKKAAKKRAS